MSDKSRSSYSPIEVKLERKDSPLEFDRYQVHVDGKVYHVGEGKHLGELRRVRDIEIIKQCHHKVGAFINE